MAKSSKTIMTTMTMTMTKRRTITGSHDLRHRYYQQRLQSKEQPIIRDVINRCWNYIVWLWTMMILIMIMIMIMIIIFQQQQQQPDRRNINTCKKKPSSSARRMRIMLTRSNSTFNTKKTRIRTKIHKFKYNSK